MDLRKRVVKALKAGKETQGALADRFSIGVASVVRLKARLSRGESIEPRPPQSGHVSVLDADGGAVLRGIVRRMPDATDHELASEFTRETHLPTSRSALNRALQRLDLTRKKKSFQASERDRPDVVAKREAITKLAQTLDAGRIHALDECGVNTSMSTRTAIAPKGERAVSKRPGSKGKNVTVVALMALAGVWGEQFFEGSMTKVRFLEYAKEVIVPQVGKGDIVLMDNLKAHHAPEVVSIIVATGAEVLFTPPYSPDFNPIEWLWSKSKTLLRRLGARTTDALFAAIPTALASATTQDIAGWFFDAGWRIVGVDS